VGALSGCSDPQTARAVANRQNNMRRTWGLYEAREADTPRRLRTTLAVAEEAERLHAYHRMVTAERLNQWCARDLERWRTNQPEYRRRIEHELEGDGPNAAWSAHKMFD